jgi:hypothetical protein
MTENLSAAWVFGDAWGMRWWWRKKKRAAEDGEPRRRGVHRDEVKDLRARLSAEGYTLKH